MENKKLVIGNMKMTMCASEINEYLKNMSHLNKQVVLCPTAIYLPYFLKKNFYVGIQNIYKEDSGAYTGEVSSKQASSMGIKYAIVGHSERRNYFKENNSLINEKVKSCLRNNLKVILCIGESLEEREMLRTNRVLKRQLSACLDGVDTKDIIIAYEPIWAIGTGLTPTNNEIEEIIKFIKGIVGEDIPVLYGGSVNEKNIESLNTINNVDGFLVGGASTDYKKFKKIVEEVTK